jgi:hypothetical protein
MKGATTRYPIAEKYFSWWQNVRVIREAVQAEDQWSRAHREVVKPDTVSPYRPGFDVIAGDCHVVSLQQVVLLVEPDDHLAIDAGLASSADRTLDVVRAKYRIDFCQQPATGGQFVQSPVEDLRCVTWRIRQISGQP